MTLSLQGITEVCAEVFGVSVDDIKGPNRCALYVRPRQAAMYLACKKTRRSLPEIGRYLGGKDHTTVLHGRDVAAKRIKDDSEYAALVKRSDELLDERAAIYGRNVFYRHGKLGFCGSGALLGRASE